MPRLEGILSQRILSGYRESVSAEEAPIRRRECVFIDSADLLKRPNTTMRSRH